MKQKVIVNLKNDCDGIYYVYYLAEVDAIEVFSEYVNQYYIGDGIHCGYATIKNGAIDVSAIREPL